MASRQIDKVYLTDLAKRLDQAPHGDKGPIVEKASAMLGISRETLYAALKDYRAVKPRKVRTNKGHSKVTEDEVLFVANLLKESRRANGKRLMTVETAIGIGRANGRVASDAATSTFLRAMRQLGVHPDQLSQAQTHINMRSLHPNHAWEFDVSVCVLYYLDSGGMAVMDQDRFYKNKPQNLAKVAKDRVLRYLVTDHYSGAFFLRYYQAPGETQETLFEFLMEAFAEKAEPSMEPFHGVPFQLVWDLGAANQSHAIQRLLNGLDIKHWAHQQGNPRAKGQVENAHNIVERGFEARLCLCNVSDLDELNEMATRWSRHFNATNAHSRHGHSRYGLWQRITEEQLRKRPAREICQSLLESKPVSRKVKGDLTIQHTVKGYPGARYSVDHLDWVRVGDNIEVRVNPYEAPCIFIIGHDERGHEVRYRCSPIQADIAGFAVDSPVIGEEYKATRDTDTDRRRRALDKDAYGVGTQADVKEARRKRQPAYGGQIDPFADLGNPPVGFMARPGTEMNLPGIADVVTKPLTHIQAWRRLHPQLDRAWTQEDMAWLKQHHPDGVPEAAIPGIVDELLALSDPSRQPTHSSVGGIK
ncbi:MAG: DDE-type integrase/transposase/recombinase [Chromatiaceae bacterium]|nr:DDE-type integrase/transposase/recombinase [Chromatiaceae bacterium]